MSKLVPIMLFSLILAYFSDRNSTFELDRYGGKQYIHKDKLFYFFMTLGMAVFVGLRTSGNDTGTYIRIYESISTGAFSNISWNKLAAAPGFQFVETILQTVGATTQEFLMLFALVTICIYLWFIHKYTSHIWLSVYFFITMGVYFFAMAAIKQTVAVAFLLVATDRAINKKYVKFVIWVLIAELFHPYSFVYLIIPFLFFAPWSKKTYALLGGTTIIALLLPTLMDGILSMTDSLGASYDANSFTGEGVNIFRVLVVWVPVVISFLARRNLRESEDRVVNLLINATMINAMVMFIGLFGTANYFARLANYFLIFQCLSLPWLFRFFASNSKRLVAILSVGAFFIYFYYQMVLAQGAFDNAYAFITIGDFLKQLF